MSTRTSEQISSSLGIMTNAGGIFFSPIASELGQPTVAAVMFCREIFSPDQYTAVYPKINLGVSIANALGYPLLDLFFDRTGKYDGALIMIITVILLSIAGVFIVYRLVAPKSQAEENS